MLTFSVSSLATGATNIAHAVATPNWDTNGSYVMNMESLGLQYPHDITLTQDNAGSLGGHGGSPTGENVYTYDITSGLVDGDSISFDANYTATLDAVTPQTIMHVVGTIAVDGTISGTWSDNYNGGERSGVLSTVSGHAVAIPPVVVIANPAVDLGSAGDFAILAKTGISTTGTTSVVGDMGISPAAATFITGFALNLPADSAFATSSLVTGKVYAPGYADPTPANLTTAVGAMETAYTSANGLAADVTELGAGSIGGLTLTRGVYKWTTGLNIPSNVTLSGSDTDVWVFQVAEDLDISSATQIILSGGAKAENVFWVVAGQTTINSTATFNGNILDQTAIVLKTGATLNGRALAQTAVTLDSNYVSDNFSAPVLDGALNAEEFGVVNYDTGLGFLKGYSAGFAVSGNTFTGATSVITKLFADETLLQTNTAILPKFNLDIVGTQITTPFDISGTFDYTADGYWTNWKALEHGQTLAATKVVAIVTLANGKIVTAENSNLTGDPATIFPNTDGGIGGDVDGGATVGVLGVSSIEVLDSTATADGTFTNGWKYAFNLTVPTDENHLAMKFSDWTRTSGSSTIAVANNMRISSPQASDTSTVLITAANTYSTPTLNMVTDLNPSLDGIQVRILVETSIPIHSVNGSYTTTYGVQTN